MTRAGLKRYVRRSPRPSCSPSTLWSRLGTHAIVMHLSVASQRSRVKCEKSSRERSTPFWIR